MSSVELQELIDKIVRKLQVEYEPEKVILFGSFACGTAQSDSDLDLLIVKETTERFIDRWTMVRRLLSDPSRTIPVETLVLTPKEILERLARGDQFLAEILHHGQVLYAAK